MSAAEIVAVIVAMFFVVGIAVGVVAVIALSAWRAGRSDDDRPPAEPGPRDGPPRWP